MNLVTTTLPNLGSGRMSRLSALWRRDISLFPSSHVPSRTQSDPLFGSLCSVFRSPLFPVFHALRIEHTAQDVIAHAGQILHAAAADHHHRVLLQIVALAGNVADHFKAVGQPHLGDLAQRRVWLLWRRRVDAGADTALLRALLQRWHFPLRVLRHARLANELVNGRHPSSSLQVQAGAHCAADANPRKTKPRHPLPGAERRLALAEDRAAARSCTDDLTFRSQRQRLSFLGRGVTPRPTSLESNYFQKLMEPGRPFRLAKLTACRKVGGMYRRRSPKSSRYGHKSATPQAFPPAARHCEELIVAWQKQKGRRLAALRLVFVCSSLRCRQSSRLGRCLGLHGSLLLAFGEDELIALDGDLAELVHHRPGSRRDQPADDDVLFEAVERVDLAVDRGLGEHARRLLERRRRDEGPGLQRRLGDAEQHRMRGCGLLTFRHHPRINLVELDLVHLFALDQIGFAGIVDLHLLQHLPNDHFDVLVVDTHALEPVDVLDLVDEVAGELLDPFDRQDVMRRGIAFDDEVALLDHVAVLQVNVLALGHEIFSGLLILIGRLDGDAPLVLVVAAEANRAGDFRNDRRLLRPPRLEQLGDTRQTAGDVAGLGTFGRDTGDDVAGLHMRAGIDRDDRVDREHVAGLAAAAELEDLALLVLDHKGRAQILLAAGRTRAPIDDDALGDAGGFVKRLGHRLAFDQVFEADGALDLGQDRPGIGIPFGNTLTALDVIAVGHLEPRAVGNAVHGAFGTIGIEHGHDQIAVHRDQIAVRIAGDVQILDLDRSFEVRFDERLLRNLCGAADMERPHGELRARLADRLGGYHADRLAHIDGRTAGKIAPVAFGADAVHRIAGENRADAHLLHSGSDQAFDVLLLKKGRVRHQDFVAGRVAHLFGRGTAENATRQRGDDLPRVDNGAHLDAARGPAVLISDNAVLRDVDQAARQIAGVRGLERGVGETLASAVRRVEVFEHREPFFEIGNDRALDDLARWLGHQAAHAGKLAHLRRRAAGAGMGHHEDRIDLRLGVLLRCGLRGGDFLHHRFGNFLGALRPGINHLVVFLTLGDQAVIVLLFEFLDGLARLLDDRALGAGHHHVVLAERNAGLERVMEAERHDAVAEDHRLFLSVVAVDGIDHAGDFALGHQLVDQIETHLRMLGQNLAQKRATRRGLVGLAHGIVVVIDAFPGVFNLAVQPNRLFLQRVLNFADIAIVALYDVLLLRIALELLFRIELELMLARAVLDHQREIVEAEHDILRRHDDRRAVGWMQDVVGRHHQDARFELRLERKRHVHRHLVAVKISVERRADQRMKLDRLAFDQDWLERLDAEAMQRRRAVEQYRMFADNLVENVPNLGLLLFDELLGLLDGGRQAFGVEPRIDERLEQFERHLLRQAALMQLEFGADHDHRTARIIDALAKQILPEPTLLAFEHVGERFERPFVGAGDDTAAAAIVEQRVHRLLQHSLLVANDDVGCAQLDQPLQAVVAVDDAAIEIVEVGRGEAAAVERHQGPQIGRDHRHVREHHPFRLIVGLGEGFNQLEPLSELLRLQLGSRFGDFLAQIRRHLLQIESFEHFADRFRADHRGEAVGAELILRLDVFLLGQELAVLERGEAGLEHDIVLEIKDALEVLECHVEQQADPARQRLQEPDMRDRRGELDVTHALAAHPRQRHLDRALLADDALVLHPLVLAAQALVILDWPEDARTEQAVALGLERAIVDRLGLFDLAVRPGLNLLRARNRNPDLVEDLRRHLRLKRFIISWFIVFSVSDDR